MSDVGESVTAHERSLSLAGSIVNGRYRVKDVGSVRPDVVIYRAEDVRSGRPVALEVLRDETAADADFVAAVREQAWTLAKSAHVHRGVARVYDCGTMGSGDLFVALEPTDGPTLRDVIDARRPLHPGTALRIASQLGEALETLHHNGLVHGQLDPESILMPTDDNGREHLVLVGVELTAASRTALGRRLREASPAPYLAPEQLERAETTEAADVYALGMLLREMLIDDKPGPTGVPPAIARIIATAVDPRPHHRYSDISVMINDMWGAQTAFAEPESRPRVVKPSPNGHPAAPRRMRRRPRGVPLAIALVVAVAIIGAALVWAVLSDRVIARRARPTAPATTATPAQKALTPQPPARAATEPPHTVVEPHAGVDPRPIAGPRAVGEPAPAAEPRPAVAPRPAADARPPAEPRPGSVIAPPHVPPAATIDRAAHAVAPRPVPPSPAPSPTVVPQQPPSAPAVVRQPPPPSVPPVVRQPPPPSVPPVVRQPPPPSAPAVVRQPAPSAPPVVRQPPPKPTTPPPAATARPPERDVGDGSAIIDWLLKEPR